MSIAKMTTQLLAATIFMIASQPSFAAIYTVKETFTGSWTASNWFSPITIFFHEATSQNLLIGDPSIFGGGSIESLSNVENIVSGVNVNCVFCFITQTLSGGDKIFSQHDFVEAVNLIPSTTHPGLMDNHFTGTFTITAGTGLFDGASGTGTFTAIDYGIVNTDAFGDFAGFNASGSYSVELNYTVMTVPEPGTYAMFLTGIGLASFAARRRRNT